MTVVIKSRLNEMAERKLEECQYGFREYRSIIDQAHLNTQNVSSVISNIISKYGGK